jgi:hypothetical protein
MATASTRVKDDITRAWDWLERWGHDTDRQPLEDRPLHDLIDLRRHTQSRVLALAESWQTWWAA